MKGGGSYSNPNQQIINDGPYNIRGLVEKKITYSPPSKPHKKKKLARRRLHTTRPYQEHLLNMADARKEIVTALKFHRASMKNHHHHQPLPSLPAPHSTSSLGLNLSFHEFTHLDFATLYNSSNHPVSDIIPAMASSPSSTSSPHEYAATCSAGCSDPDQVGTAPPCQLDGEIDWNYSFLLQEDQFGQEFPLFSNSADTSTGTNLGLPCMKLEEFDELEEWLSWH